MESEKRKMFKGRDILLYLAEANNGDWDSIYKDVRAKRRITDEQMEEVLSKDLQFVTLLDKNYPETLKNGYQPPFVLYYEGNIELLDDSRKKIAILNSTLASQYANESIDSICKNVNKRYILVMPFGTAKQNSLIKNMIKYGIDVIAVLNKGIGIDNQEDKELYEELVKNHLIITEFPKQLEKKTSLTDKSLVKNQVSLSNAVLVGGISKKSNEMCGIAYALSKGVEVMCIPFPVGSKFMGNELIKDGATLVDSLEDLIHEIN